MLRLLELCWKEQTIELCYVKENEDNWKADVNKLYKRAEN